MEKNKDELINELNELKKRYSNLENDCRKEVENLRKELDDLRMKLMFLDGVANSSVDGFLVVNPYGQKILQNKRTVELWKIPQEVVDDPDGMKQVNHVMHMTVNPEQFVAEIDYLREHPDEQSRDELELIDGTVLDRYSSPVIGPDGKNYGRIWTFHDITELKNFEKQLIQLNKDKDHFISILAHDLRSPFNSILGFLALLNSNLDTYSEEKTKNMVDTIYTMAKKTYELLEDTLLWASVQTKKIVFNPAKINVTNVISEVLDILSPSAKLKNISIINHYKNDLEILVDVYMLKTILRNLISNAIKFTHDEGKIDIGVNDEETKTIFSVSDNGIGIDPEFLKKMFNTSTFQSTLGTSNEMGTGLGLLLCKEFVEMHDGKIWIDSVVDKGTKVSFSIPKTNR